MSLFRKKPKLQEQFINAMTPIAASLKEASKPTNRIFTVNLSAFGRGGETKHIVAQNEKAAVLKYLEDIPGDDPFWTQGGCQGGMWRESSQAFVL